MTAIAAAAMEVAHHAEMAERHLGERDQAIRAMRAKGASLRAIAEAAGLSPNGVKKILDRNAGDDAAVAAHVRQEDTGHGRPPT